MDVDSIERHIAFIATALQDKVDEVEIAGHYVAEDFPEEEVWLLIEAAKLLQKDRETPKSKITFRRSV